MAEATANAFLYDELDLRLCRIGDHVTHALEGRQDRLEALATIEALARSGVSLADGLAAGE